MNNLTTKELLEKYIKLCTWYFIKEDDHDITSEQFSAVLNEIGRLEDELKMNGVSDKSIAQIVDKTRENALHKPVGEMTDAELLKVCKLIFGNETEFEGGYTP